MNRNLFYLILIFICFGCVSGKFENGKDRFVNDRNYDVNREVSLSYAMPPVQVSFHNGEQYKYIFQNESCSWAYYVDRKTKVVQSWEYISSPAKCSTGLDWFGLS